jgi:hypothetical protein
MKPACIHQPDFLPYLGFFHRLLYTDLLIILDDVQFLRRGWHHRDLIKGSKGAQWLTLSIKKGDYHQNINQVILHADRDRWISNHLNLLRANYSKAPFFKAYFPQIEAIYRKKAVRMIDLNMAFLHFFFDLFGLDNQIVLSSDLGVEGKSNLRLINLLKSVDRRRYLSGIGARDYLDERQFQAAGIRVDWQRFDHPVYPQLHGKFIPNLSCIDILFNCGPEAEAILKSCKTE